MTESNVVFSSRVRQRTPLVYGILFGLWAVVLVWQGLEHRWGTAAGRAALINHSRDIATTLSLVIRSQRHFGGIVSEERLESALNELVKSGDLISVALLNASGDVVASAGKPINLEKSVSLRHGEHWEDESVTLVNLIDLGATLATEGETNRPTIVLSWRDTTNTVRGAGRGFERGETRPEEPAFSNAAGRAATNADLRAGGQRGRSPRPRFGRPFWMDEKEYQSLTKARGLHGLVMSMSTESLRAASVDDFWLRFIIACFATVSTVGLGMAWQNLVRSSVLQESLLRASELNTHLRDMNVAAAGLAHETRNPLNIVRGLAQMISREPAASKEVRERSRQITEEVDRVTVQLNEFINFSRPREVRRVPVALSSVLGDISRALQSDIEDKRIRLKVDDGRLTVEADEQMLRQAIFNLVMNSLQAVDTEGEVEIAAQKTGPSEAQVEVRDSGPGVPPEHRDKLFKPYFTTHPKGTGLGLAVVQQIARAHGWSIDYIASAGRGTAFRLSRLKLSSKAPG